MMYILLYVAYAIAMLASDENIILLFCSIV